MLFWSSEEQTTRREGSKSLPSPFKGGSRCYSGLARCRPRPVKATDPCLHHKKAAPWWQPPCWHLPCTGYRLPCLCKIPSGPPAPSSRFPPQATILHGRSRTNVQMAAGKRTRLSRLDRPQTDFNRQWRKCQCHRKKVYARALDCGGLRCEGLRWSAGDCGGLRWTAGTAEGLVNGLIRGKVIGSGRMDWLGQGGLGREPKDWGGTVPE